MIKCLLTELGRAGRENILALGHAKYFPIIHHFLLRNTVGCVSIPESTSCVAEQQFNL